MPVGWNQLAAEPGRTTSCRVKPAGRTLGPNQSWAQPKLHALSTEAENRTAPEMHPMMCRRDKRRKANSWLHRSLPSGTLAAMLAARLSDTAPAEQPACFQLAAPPTALLSVQKRSCAQLARGKISNTTTLGWNTRAWEAGRSGRGTMGNRKEEEDAYPH